MAEFDVVARLLEEAASLHRRAEELLRRERLDDGGREELLRAIKGIEDNLRYVDYERVASPRKAVPAQLEALRRDLSALREKAQAFAPPTAGGEAARAELASKAGQLDGLLGAGRNVNEANLIAADIGMQLEKDMQTFLAGRVTVKLMGAELTVSRQIIAAIDATRRQTDLLFKAGVAAPLLFLLLYSALRLLRLFAR